MLHSINFKGLLLSVTTKKKRIIIIIINHPTCFTLTGYGCSKHMHVQNFGYKQKNKNKKNKKKLVMLNAHWTKTKLI